MDIGFSNSFGFVLWLRVTMSRSENHVRADVAVANNIHHGFYGLPLITRRPGPC